MVSYSRLLKHIPLRDTSSQMYRHRVHLLEASCTINHHKRVDHLRVHHEHLTDQLFALRAQASHYQCLVSCAITYWQSGTPTKHQPRWMSAASIFLLRPHRHSHNKVCSREREREFSTSIIMFSHSCKTEHYWMYVRGSPRHQIPGRVRSTLRPGTHRFRIRTVKSLHSLIFRRILRGCAPRPCSITAGPPAHDE